MSAAASRRSVFAQLVLVIALVLGGTAVLALAVVRQAVTGPAAAQFLHSMNAFADVAEALAREGTREVAAARLRAAGLRVSEREPPPLEPGRAPIVRAILAEAPERLAGQRQVRYGDADGARVLWIRLDTAPPLWVSFAFERGRRDTARVSLPLIAAGSLLVLLGAAYAARRLVLPLRALSAAAPAIVRGEPPGRSVAGGPREVGELAAALVAAGREVRDAADERTLMLAGISHDLRTPLTRLQYAVELMPGTDPALGAGMHRDIAEIDAILRQFIAYARDGRGETPGPLDLAATCRNVETARAAHWRFDLPAFAPVTGRRLGLLRAIENLVANAERHGAPPFSLRLDRVGDHWRIEVGDHGPGLADDLLERARQPFVHGPRGGTGLGLAIVDRVARQHHGALLLARRAPHGLVATLTVRTR